MKVLRAIVSAIKWLLFVLLVVVLLVTVMARIKGETPSLFGYQINIVVTGSMEPEISVGDVIIGKKYNHGDKISVGDVVTYYGTSGNTQGKFITHKVQSADLNPDGSYTVVTKGVANSNADDPINSSQIQSIMVHNTVVLKYVYQVLTSTVGFFLVVVLPILIMIVTEIVSIVKTVKDPQCDTTEQPIAQQNSNKEANDDK